MVRRGLGGRGWVCGPLPPSIGGRGPLPPISLGAGAHSPRQRRAGGGRVDFATFDSLVVPPGTSAAEQIAAAAPDARVVKACSTAFAGTLVAGQAGGAPLDVFIAGDDAEAKQAVADVAAAGGLRPIDAGPLRRARELEGFQFLHMTLQQTLGTGWSSAIKIVS